MAPAETVVVTVHPALRLLAGLARVVFTIALVAWIVARLGPHELLAALEAAEPAWLLASVLTLAPSIALRAKTLEMLANKDEPTVTFGQAASLTLVGMSAAAVLPPGVSDAVRAHVGYRTLGRPESVVSASLVERLVSLFSLAVLAALAGVLTGEPAVAALACAAAGATFVVIRWRRVVPWAWLVRVLSPGAQWDPERLEASHRLSARTFAATTACAAAGWVSSAATTYCVCVALHAEVGFSAVVLATMLTALSRLLPVTVGGIGVGELTLSYLLVRAGASADAAASVALATLFVGLLLPAALGMFAMPRRRPRPLPGLAFRSRRRAVRPAACDRLGTPAEVSDL